MNPPQAATLRGRPGFLPGTLAVFALAGTLAPLLRPNPIFFARAERFDA